MPSRSATAAVSRDRRLLPSPAGPPISTIAPCPSAAASSTVRSCSRSATLPTYGVGALAASDASRSSSSSSSGTGTRYSRHSALIPFSSNMPWSTSAARAVPSTPCTVSDTRIPPGGASPSIRLAMITVSPWMSPSSPITSPVCSPIRICTASSRPPRWSRPISTWIDPAAATARRTEAKAAISPSPISLISTPRLSATTRRAICSTWLPIARAASSPSVWLRRVDSTRSVNNTVTVPSGISCAGASAISVGQRL